MFSKPDEIKIPIYKKPILTVARDYIEKKEHKFQNTKNDLKENLLKNVCK